MSQEMYDYAKGMAVSVFDLFVGYSVGQVIDMPFNYPSLLPINDMDGFWKVLGVVVFETCLTSLSLLTLRKLMYPADMLDETGGMFFMMSLTKQPALWANIQGLWDYIYGKVRKVPAGAADNASGNSSSVDADMG